MITVEVLSIRVRASDGFNVTVAEVGNLILAHDAGPDVVIYSPSDGHTVISGSLLVAGRTANDREDGPLPDTALQWTSSIDGLLGNGRHFELPLSVGTHTLTLQVTDSAGHVGSASLSIQVLP